MSASEKKYIDIIMRMNDQMGNEIAQMTKNMNEAAAASAKMTMELREEFKVQKQAAESARDLAAAQKRSAQAHKEGGDLVSGAMSRIKAQMVGMIAAYISLNAAVGLYSNGLKYIAETGGGFQQALANTGAQLQISREDTLALSESAKVLGATTVATATEVANAQTEMGKVGFTTGQILLAQKDVMDLSAAANIDLSTAANATAITIRQFGLSAGDTQEVVDVMTSAVSKSALEMQDFTLAMSYIGPVASAAGFSLSETSAAVAELSNKGMDAGTIGTSLRRIITTLGDSSSQAAKMLAKTHPEAKTLTEKMAALGAMGMDTTAAVKLFRIEASTAAGILASSSEEVKKLGEELEWTEGKAKGFAASVAATQMDTFQGDLKEADGALETFAITLSQAFSDKAREGVQLLTANLNDLTIWAKENPDKLREWASAAQTIFNTVIIAAKGVAKAVELINDAATSIIGYNTPVTIEDRFIEQADKAGRALSELSKHQLELSKYKAIGGISNTGEIRRETEAVERLTEESNLAVIERNRLFSIMKETKASYTGDENLSAEQQALLKTLNEVIPTGEIAVRSNKTYAESERLLAESIAERRKQEAAKTTIKGKTAEVAAETGMDPDAMKEAEKEMAKNAKAANEQYRKILRDREIDELTAQQREIRLIEEFWDKALEVDKAGGSRHVEELTRMREEAINKLLAVDLSKINSTATFYGRGVATDYNPTPTTSFASQGEGVMETGEAARAEALNRRYQEENQSRMQAAEAIYIELENSNKTELELEQEKYDAKLELLEAYGKESAELTKQHEDAVIDIQAKALVSHLEVAASAMNGFTQLANVAAKGSRDWVKTAKALAIAEATINVAVGITKAFAMGGPLGFITGAGVAAAGAAQIATISMQEYARGQYSSDASFGVVPGTSYSGDRVPAWLNSGERVLTARENVEYEKRSSGGGNTFHYAPVYNTPTTALDRRRDTRNFQKQMRAANGDPSFSRVQAAYV